MPALRIISPTAPDYADQVRALLAILRSGALVAADVGSTMDVGKTVADILTEVRTGGDRAAAALTSKLDRAVIAPDAIRVPEAEIARAHREADPEFMALVRRVAENIRVYQEHIRHRDPAPLVRGGRRLGV